MPRTRCCSPRVRSGHPPDAKPQMVILSATDGKIPDRSRSTAVQGHIFTMADERGPAPPGGRAGRAAAIAGTFIRVLRAFAVRNQIRAAVQNRKPNETRASLMSERPADSNVSSTLSEKKRV
jgi:hypothetical protein